MFDSYLKGVYGVYVYGWSESSCNTDYGKDEVSGFFSVLQNRNLIILARPSDITMFGFLCFPFGINNENKKVIIN